MKQAEPPWGADDQTPNFDYCDCCGVEFGYGDATIMAAKKWRANWISGGAHWAEPSKKPIDWDIAAQLTEIPAAFK